MGVRKNAAYLTAAERDDFLEAVLTIKNTIANPGDPANQQISIFDQFVAIHLYCQSMNVPGFGSPSNMGHQNSAFGPWHRYFILRLEQALQAVNPNVNLPYWDWTDHTSTQNIIFQDNFMGPNGGPGGGGGGTIRSGYFAFDAPGSGTNPTPLPAWWPAGLAGWRVKSQLQQGLGNTVQRNLQAFTNLEVQADVLTCLAKTNYEGSGLFRTFLEGGLGGTQHGMHNGMHNWVGGNMSAPSSSPNDLIFFLHHCNIDRLWAMWQIDGHEGNAFYPAAGRPPGHNLNDPMWPWVGGLAGYSSNNAQTNIVLPDFSSEPIQHPADVLNHRALGYAYDTEAIVGIALDQTGSMTGMTPDPMTGIAPNISKWDAAKSGVSALLHDCETAYAAAEAYVIAGVETFRNLGANTFTQIFPGTHYGIVKASGAITQASFDSNIATQTPGGGTPLAGALTDTDTNLVRAPFSNLPAGEQRYLSILTDGKETSSPLLSTLSTHAFPNTLIFGMGFGIGGGWDGVDYSTISTMTSKGKSAPTGVALVHHGENAGAIDKFYTDSIAASIGYTPSVDPVYDLYPGEHVHQWFDVTDADQSFMITAQGFDFSDKNWDFCLMAPSGRHCADTMMGGMDMHNHDESTETLSPFLVTMKQKKGRCTIFLNRNGADSNIWVGRWALMAMYKADMNDPMMIMPNISTLVLATGTPPIRGPLYTRYNKKPTERIPVRAIAGRPAHQLSTSLPGITTLSKEPPCAVAINIYNRTSQKVILESKIKEYFAGEDIFLSINLSNGSGGRLELNHVAARLVAPNYSLGNILADLESFPLGVREKFINRDNTEEPFNILLYLAEYERLHPNAFPIRDEEIRFKVKKNGKWEAHIKENKFPGVYRVGVFVQGTYYKNGVNYDDPCCREKPQAFTKVLHANFALGIKPNGKETKPTFNWLNPNKFVISASMVDKFGNAAFPSDNIDMITTVNGKSVKSDLQNLFTGELQSEISLKGRKILVSQDGQSIESGEPYIETIDGKKLFIKSGQKLKIGLKFKDNKFKVAFPKFVGDIRKQLAYLPGTRLAMKIPIENRQPLYSKKEAQKLGYKIVYENALKA